MGTVLLLVACGGGGGDIISPFWTHSGLVVADIDDDGRVDVAVAATYVAGPPPHPGYVRIYRQSSPGAFNAPAQYSVGPDPWGLAVGDFDGDGRPDLVAATLGDWRLRNPMSSATVEVSPSFVRMPCRRGAFCPRSGFRREVLRPMPRSPN